MKSWDADCNVGFAPDCIGLAAEEMAHKLEKGQTLLLENLRFHAEEEANDEAFSRKLAALADVYVNDAFGSAHRAHASTVGITRFLEKSAAGLLMQKELEYLGKATTNPEKPFVAIIGGAKVSDKIDVIRNLLAKVDALLIGGAMAYTFLKAQGSRVGKSLVEEDKLELAKSLLQDAQSKNVRLLLPSDNVIAAKIDAAAQTQTVKTEQGIPDDQMGLDIGPETIAAFSKEIAGAKTIVWNGPMGVFEVAPFAQRHHENCRSRCRQPRCNFHCRRRGFGCRRASVRPGGQDHAYLHRRRGLSGVPGRQKTAGRGSAHRQINAAQACDTKSAPKPHSSW